MNITREFAVQIKWAVAWGDMDSLGHVNNSVYFKYFEIARSEYFTRIGFSDFLTREASGIILANISCNFLCPLSYPDRIEVGARVRSMKKDSFTMEYYIMREGFGLAAFGQSEIMMYDYRKREQVELLPDLRSAIEAMEKKRFDT